MSEAESWEEVQSEREPDVDMAEQTDPNSVYLHQGEVDAANHLTKLYHDLMLNQQMTPEDAFATMLQTMQNEEQTRMLYKWDHMGRQ